MDKIGLIKAAARNLGALTADETALAATATSIDVSALVQPYDKQLKGQYLYIYAGAGAGQSRAITDFQSANNRCLVEQAFSPVPSINSQLLIFEQLRKSDYDNALDRALGIAKLRYMEEKSVTITLVGTQYEYPVPSGFKQVSALRLVPSAGSTDYSADDEVNRIFELHSRYYRIEPNANGSVCIVFDSRAIKLSTLDEEQMRVIGQSKMSISPTDNATIPEAIEEFAVAKMTQMLAANRIAEGTEWQSKFLLYKREADELEAYIHTPRRGKRV